MQAMKRAHRAMLDGTLPWSTEEDAILRDQYPLFKGHPAPLRFQLLASQLPPEGRRQESQVKKRLEELGLLVKKTKEDLEGDGIQQFTEEVEENPSKKPRSDADVGGDIGQPAEEARASLEMDLEKMLDSVMPEEEPAQGTGLTPSVGQGLPDENLGLDLEMELEKMMEDGLAAMECGAGVAQEQNMEFQASTFRAETMLDSVDNLADTQVDADLGSQNVSASQNAWLERELASMLNSQEEVDDTRPPVEPRATAERSGSVAGACEATLPSGPSSREDIELDLEAVIDEAIAGDQSQSVAEGVRCADTVALGTLELDLEDVIENAMLQGLTQD